MLSQAIAVKKTVTYKDIPHFPEASVSGHASQLLFGHIANVPVICMAGRGHYYEGLTANQLAIPIILFKRLGVQQVILTNAAGSLNPDIRRGELAVITDHINLQGQHPLVGAHCHEFFPRFYPMDNAYNDLLRQQLLAIAAQLQICLHQGVYAGMLGPSYETPAEIRALRLLGADLVGMSTVPETLVARAVGMEVVAISSISNMAAGLSEEYLTHEQVLHVVEKAHHNLCKLITSLVGRLGF